MNKPAPGSCMTPHVLPCVSGSNSGVLGITACLFASFLSSPSFRCNISMDVLLVYSITFSIAVFSYWGFCPPVLLLFQGVVSWLFQYTFWIVLCYWAYLFIFNSFYGLLFSLNKILFVFLHYQWCTLILMCQLFSSFFFGNLHQRL